MIRRPILGMRGVILGTFFLASARVLSACQCGHVPSPLEALPQSLAVFDGTVVGRAPVLRQSETGRWIVERVTFRVHEVWRGPQSQLQVLFQGYSNCDTLFQVGSRYLVFARQGALPGTTTSSICLPTRPFEQAGGALRELPPGLAVSSPEHVAPESPPRVRLRHTWVCFLAGVVLTSEVFTFPRWAVQGAVPAFYLGPASVFLAIVFLSVLAARRKFRVLAISVLPALFLVALSLALQGFLVLRVMPLSWRLLDYFPTGA